MFGGGSFVPLSRLGPSILQPPAVFSNPSHDAAVAALIDQYTQQYQQYTKIFDVYAQESAWDQGFYQTPAQGTVSPYQPPAPTAPVRYYDFRNGARLVGTDYVSQYENYVLRAAVNLNQADGSNGFAGIAGTDGCVGSSSCSPIAAPFAPVGQLETSLEAGYTTSPAVTTTVTVTVPAHLAGPLTPDMIATIQAHAIDAIANNPWIAPSLDPLYGSASQFDVLNRHRRGR
jgi:hypothetical protein